MSPIYLVARRDYLAYVGAWGFWASLIAAPVILLALVIGPIVLAKAEPSRVVSILADRPADAAIVSAAFDAEARDDARGEILAYVSTAAPRAVPDVAAAFDAAASRTQAVAAAHATLARLAPGALAAFPSPQPRYIVAPAPAAEIDGLRPYLSGEQRVVVGGAARPLYGALRIRREADGPAIEYWSVYLSHTDPSDIAARAMRLEMRRESLAAQGLGAGSAEALDALAPRLAQFDPRGRVGQGAVTVRDRAPFYASLLFAFMLWSVVFGAANMLLSSIMEERSNKILDTLLTSVTPLEMLIGKLIAVAAVTVTLFLVWGSLGGELLHLAATRASQNPVGQIAAAFLEPRLLVAFMVGFVAGYLMYGAIFLALGALCESIQDAQTLLGPATLVLALPMMLLAPALDNPNSPVVAGASWFPLFTPFLMIVRAPAGLSWIEIGGMGALMLATIVIVLRLAARVFHAGVVHQASVSNWRKKPAKA